MKHLMITLFILSVSALVNASEEQCHFEIDTFQCAPGYVKNGCVAGGHHGVRGCTCCLEKTSNLNTPLMSFASEKIVVDGFCTITRASGSTRFPIHSEVAEKQALGFAGESGARHRLELVNNSETPFAATAVIQVAVDRDEYVKNPPQLCPTQPVDEGLKCERANNALYPPYTRFAAFDNTDGIAIPVGYPGVYRKSLTPSEFDHGPVLFTASKIIDNVEARCELMVSQP